MTVSKMIKLKYLMLGFAGGIMFYLCVEMLELISS